MQQSGCPVGPHHPVPSVQERLVGDLLDSFDNLPQEIRLKLWEPDLGLRDEILRRWKSYREETRTLILRMVMESADD